MIDVDVFPSDTSWLSEPTTGVHQFGGGSRGKFSVSCAVSMRWLRFQEKTGYVGNDSEAVVVDVMTDFDGRPSRKLCELVLELDDLRAILKQYEAKSPATN
jgi:hypothetical protein